MELDSILPVLNHTQLLNVCTSTVSGKNIANIFWWLTFIGFHVTNCID
jgi:hypothetical protein